MWKKAVRLVLCFVLIMALFPHECLGLCVSVLCAAQGAKYSLIGMLVPGLGWACVGIGIAWGVASVAATAADVDPPVTNVAQIDYVATYPGGESTESVHPRDIIQIVGTAPGSFEYVPSQNRVLIGNVKATVLKVVSMQKTLVVIVPPGVNPGTVDLTVENSIGVSFGYALNVTNIGNLSVPALGSGAAYQLAHTFGVATRDFFVAFDNLAAATPELQAQELPNMDSVNVWLDAYFAYIDTASPGMLAQIDSIILEGDVDVIGQTYECIDSLRYSYGVPTFHDRRTGIVLIVVLIALAAVIVYRRRGAVVK